MVEIKKDFIISPVSSLSPGDLVCCSGRRKPIIGFVINNTKDEKDLVVLKDEENPDRGVYMGYYSWVGNDMCVSYGNAWFVKLICTTPSLKAKDVSWLTPGIIAVGANLQTLCAAARPQDFNSTETPIDLVHSKITSERFLFDDHVLVDNWEVWLSGEAEKGDAGKPLVSFPQR